VSVFINTQGFVRPPFESDDDPLLSTIEISNSEGAVAFHLPLTASTACLFRGRRPYTAIDGTGLAQLGEEGQVGLSAISNEVANRET